MEHARAEAARKRAAGSYREDSDAVRELEEAITGPVTPGQLREWALIEVDTSLIRSTRRAGAPLTWLKRALLRAPAPVHERARGAADALQHRRAGTAGRARAPIAELERERS